MRRILLLAIHVPVIRTQLVAAAVVALTLGAGMAWAGDPPNLSGRSRDAYERAADKVFSGPRTQAFRDLDARTQMIASRVDRAGSGGVGPGGVCMLTSAKCAAETYGLSFGVCLGGFLACEGGPIACFGGVSACLESVSGAREKFEKCKEESKAPPSGPARGEHGGLSPAGSPSGAAAATGL